MYIYAIWPKDLFKFKAKPEKSKFQSILKIEHKLHPTSLYSLWINNKPTQFPRKLPFRFLMFEGNVPNMLNDIMYVCSLNKL